MTILPNVMIVDDDKAFRDSLQRALRSEPYRLVFADSAVHCLEVLTGLDVQVIVSDRSMPGINGAELLEHLHSSRPNIVRIMLSGDLHLKNAIEAINVCHAFRVLQKPCSVSMIAMAIREGLQCAEQLRASKRLLEVLQMQAHYIRSMDQPLIPSEHESPTFEESDGEDLDEVLKAAVKQVEEIEALLTAKSKKKPLH